MSKNLINPNKGKEKLVIEQFTPSYTTEQIAESKNMRYGYASLEEATKFFISNNIHRDIKGRLLQDPHSRAYHLTVTFRPVRFQSDAWTGQSGPNRHQKISEAADDMFQQFEAWWIKALGRTVPNFTRPQKRRSQPICHAFIDDTQESSPYPHIHAIVWVPSCTVPAFRKWHFSKDPARASKAAEAWWALEGMAKIDIRNAFEDDQHLWEVAKYVTKYVRKVEVDNLRHRKWLNGLGTRRGVAEIIRPDGERLMRYYPA